MSAKKLLGIALVAVAIIAPEVIPGILGVAAGSFAAIAATAAVEIGIGLAETALVGPTTAKLPTTTDPRSRLYATLDTTAPRKIAFGHTAFATDIRYQSYTGTDQDHYQQILACAAHKVQSIDEIWLDNEQAWTAGGGVQGRYVGYLTVNAITEGTNANGIAIDSTWTSACTLTGCAYVHLDFLLVGPDSSTPSPFQGGVSNRITIRGKGALIYDPRLDSTVEGGSGSQRADDQTTWAWDDDASRNPALQELWYELGWKINDRLSVGKGLPPARLDLAAYAVAANICDESVSLNAGGSEPRYRSDGVLSEGDDPKTVRDAICATMNATLRDYGGSISLQIIYNDLSSIAVDFDEDDILGDEEWDQTPALTETFNIVRGKYVDASDNALYQLSDYPEIAVDSPDGIDRINTFDSGLVQSVTQMQRLAKLRLMRNQFQGRYSASMKPKAWQCSVGNVVTQTHAGLSWAEKLFRPVGQTISVTGQTQMVMQEEDASIYDWNPATDEQAGIDAGTPTVYDPSNNPLLTPPPSDAAAILRASYPVVGKFRIMWSDTGSNITVSIDNGTASTAFTVDIAETPPVEKTVPAHDFTGLAYSTTYFAYIDIADLAAFVAATNPVTPTAYGIDTYYPRAVNSSTNPNRLYLGTVTTPASGGGSGSSGSGSTGGGGVGSGGELEDLGAP